MDRTADVDIPKTSAHASPRRDCYLIAQQLTAAKVALERATVQLMATSMAECIRPKSEGGVDRDELQRITSMFVKLLA